MQWDRYIVYTKRLRPSNSDTFCTSADSDGQQLLLPIDVKTFLYIRFYVFFIYGTFLRFLTFLWPPYVIGQAIYIFILWFLLSIFLFFPRLISAVGDWIPYFHTWCGLSVNLECRSDTCCARLAENTACKNRQKVRHLGTIPQLCRAISSQLRHVSTIGKKLLSSNISSTCSHNMVNFGPLAAEIVSGVWGTPATFNGFHVLTALLRGM